MSTKKTFTPDEAAQIAVEYGRMRVNQIAKSLKDLRDRELKKAIIKPHPNHSTGTTSGSGTEDVPPGKVNPPGQNDAMKGEDDWKVKPAGQAHPSQSPDANRQKKLSQQDAASASGNKNKDFKVIGEHLKTEETPGEKSHGEHSPSELCKMCGKSHGMEKGCNPMDKAMLKDAKGKEKDNGIDPKSVLPEDKKSEEMTHDGSGGDITKGKKLGKSLADIRKAATPPMAMPPSGKNMNTHVPTSKPAGAMAKEVKEMVVHGSKAVAPPKGADYDAKQKGDKAVYVAKDEQAMVKAGPAEAATQPGRPGIFGRLGATKTLVPPPGLKTAAAGLHPAGGGPKPMTAMSATHQPPKTEVSLGSTQGGAPSLAGAAPTAPNNMPKSPMATPAKPVSAKGPNALGSIIGAPPVVAPASTKSLAPAPTLKPAGMALEPAGAPPMKQVAPPLPANKNAVTVNSKPKP